MNKLRLWLIHKLGGHAPFEVRIIKENTKNVETFVSQFTVNKQYPVNYGELRVRTIDELLERLRPYVKLKIANDREYDRTYEAELKIIVTEDESGIKK